MIIYLIVLFILMFFVSFAFTNEPNKNENEIEKRKKL